MSAPLTDASVVQLVHDECAKLRDKLSFDVANRLVDLAKSETADSAAVRRACDAIDPSSETAVLVTIAIPSKKKGKPIHEDLRSQWHNLAMAILGESFKGCTSLGGSHIGLWARPSEEEAEQPHLVQAYAAIDELSKTDVQNRLREFMRSMCITLTQDCTMLIVGGRRFLFYRETIEKEGSLLQTESDMKNGIKNFATLNEKITDAIKAAQQNELSRLTSLLSNPDNAASNTGADGGGRATVAVNGEASP